MIYKGFIGHVKYNEDNKTLFGRVINTRTTITFEATTVKNVENEFKKSVDFYISWCRKRGKDPEKPFPGKFSLRISPELHKKAVVVSTKKEISLNKFIEQAIEQIESGEIEYEITYPYNNSSCDK